MTEYTPCRYWRLCPTDSHTCTDRECLKGFSPECPKAAKPATADAGGPTAPGRGWEYTGDWC